MDNSTNTITQLIAIGAFVMSGVSLYLSIAKHKYKQEIATAEQTALLLLKMGEMEVQILKYGERLNKLRSRYAQSDDPRLKSIEIYIKVIKSLSKIIDGEVKNVDSGNLAYRDIKLQQSHYDTMNSVLEFVIQGADELLTEIPK